MILSPNRFSVITVNNSITNAADDQKFDLNKPFTFIEFLNYSKALIKSSTSFADYQNYIKAWNAVTSTGNTDYNTQIREQFIEFLKTISLNYMTSEERRFLKAINYNNPDDLEIAVPFFVQKIKEVVLYYAGKRDTYKVDYNVSKNKGTITGASTFIKTAIIDTLFGDDNTPQITVSQPLTAINNRLAIEIEEGYDIQNDYFDLDPTKLPEFYNQSYGQRNKYFTANTNVNDPDLFTNFDKAIIDQINSEGVVLAALQDLVINVGSPDLTLMQPYDFDDYSTITRSNLRLLFDAELIKRFTGTDFYYLSTNAAGKVLSGVMFEATSPFANLLNIYNPATLTVPDMATRYERDVGLFFKPTKWSVLKLQTPFSYFTKNTIKADNIYFFPDPTSYGNISNTTKLDYDTPFNFNQEGQKIQKNISSNGAMGNSYVTNNDSTFESYHSEEQNAKISAIDQFVNAGVVTNLVSDIYGNLFVGYKQINTNYIAQFNSNLETELSGVGVSSYSNTPYISSIKILNTNGTQINTESIEQSVATHGQTSIYTTRYTPGNFYVYNITQETFVPLSAEFVDVFEKYPAELYDLQNSISNIEVYGSIYVFTTNNTLIIDKIVYDKMFYKSSSVPLILSSSVDSAFSNVFLVSDELYVAQYSVIQDQLSSTNQRRFTLDMYRYNTVTNTSNTCEYLPLSTNIFDLNFFTKVDINKAHLSYNSKTGIFNIVVDLKDLNKNLFIHSIQLTVVGGGLYVQNHTYYTCTNLNKTINFYEAGSSSLIKTNAILTTPTISNIDGTIIL